MLHKYHADIEFDFRRLGVDLLDYWRGTLTARAIFVLLRRLPPESAFVRAAAPDAALIGSWSATTYVLADLFDATVRLAGRDANPYPRPGEVIKKRDQDDARRAALVERYQKRQGLAAKRRG